MEGRRGAAAWRSALRVRAHCVTLTLRLRREACNWSRALSATPLSGSPSIAALRIARRNTSDFDTFQRCANASSVFTDSTSSEYVDLMVCVAMWVMYCRTQAASILLGIRRKGNPRLRCMPERVQVGFHACDQPQVEHVANQSRKLFSFNAGKTEAIRSKSLSWCSRVVLDCMAHAAIKQSAVERTVTPRCRQSR